MREEGAVVGRWRRELWLREGGGSCVRGIEERAKVKGGRRELGWREGGENCIKGREEGAMVEGGRREDLFLGSLLPSSGRYTKFVFLSGGGGGSNTR